MRIEIKRESQCYIPYVFIHLEGKMDLDMTINIIMSNLK